MKFTPYKGDLISRKRLMFELGESNMPKKYREFCLRVLSSENLSPTVEPKVKEPCEWCEGNARKYFDVNLYDFTTSNTTVARPKTKFCPFCGRDV